MIELECWYMLDWMGYQDVNTLIVVKKWVWSLLVKQTHKFVGSDYWKDHELQQDYDVSSKNL